MVRSCYLHVYWYVVALAHLRITDVSGTDTLNCNFDQDLCNWDQIKGDDFDWTRVSGGTPTNNTGPNADHTSGGGFYVYIDTSSKEVKQNDKARLISPYVNDSGTYCFSFWYYMYGEHVDMLRVFKAELNWTKLIKLQGSKGQSWTFRQKQFNANHRFKIIIDGKVKNSDNHDLGEIAIDDVVMLSGPCPSGCDDPKPEFGFVNSTKFGIGSVVRITCLAGYTLSGSSLIVCLANGTWSGIPECNPKDCGIRNITNGKFTAMSGTTFGQTARQSCNIGYRFSGDEAVICTESGWNGSEARCTIVDCLMPSIDNGKVTKSPQGTTYNSNVRMACVDGYKLHGNAIVTCRADGNWTTLPSCIIAHCSDPTPSSGSSNSTNFQYRSVIEIKCVSGYKIKGAPSIVCQANGNWSSNPDCELIDCSIPIILHGNTSEIVGDTKYNNSVMLACSDGYILTGNRIVTCQADGNWTTLPKCHIQDSGNNTLMIMYVVVPIAVIALFVGLFCIIRRKMLVKCITTQFSNRKDDKKCKPQPGYNFTNESYSRHNTEPSSGIESPPPPNTEYVVVTDDQNRNENADYSIYYNTADATLKGQADDDHDYDHTNTVASQFFDSTYSHVLGKKSNYNTTMFSCYSNEAFQTDTQDENDTYDILNVTDSKQISAKELTLAMPDDQDPAYDHAKAGGVDPVDLDDYSHLNESKTKPTDITLNGFDGSEYVNANEISKREAKVCDRNNASQKQQSGSPSQTVVCKAETQHTTEDERNYFVLEKEEKDSGQSDSNELNDHEYFVLEKMET